MNQGYRFHRDLVASDPLVQVTLNASHQPVGATAACVIPAGRDRVWEVIQDVERYAGRVPMIHRVRRTDDRVRVDLKFKVALFSVGFSFTADLVYAAGEWLAVRYVDGEPRDFQLDYALEELDAGRTLLHTRTSFDVNSLGWLVKYFLKHHPEIQLGIMPGVALGVLDAIRAAALSP
jgi:ribosome-associated toxin RatA of RatAB toxin-antitoxin module